MSIAQPSMGGVGGGDTDHPDRIGPFKILEVLGEGGMGVVYLAEQREPVRRRVALKVIKLGMDTRQVLARFEAERQALAMMEHGCIAKVYEAGASESGQPYFAMEYIKGIPITNYCDENKLDLRARLALFNQLCSGVQHAHHKGIIHRDIKPANVLVTLQDGGPHVKIIDFGLARATDHVLQARTLFTEHGALIGTAEYMSPEQAGLGGLDIDTRTDVYSLGVILYELLTGDLPFPSRDLREAGMLEVQRKIREDDPPKPSSRVTRHGPERSHSEESARARHTDAKTLARNLKEDLDWVVLKALEKDRTRRYATPEALAEDLERYLVDEPVLASPPSAAYRLRKFVRRYRLRVVGAALLLLSLLAGTVGTTWGMLVAAEQRKIAEAARTKSEFNLQRFNQVRYRAALDQALQDEDRLYPAWPEQAPALQRWLDEQGGPLLAARAEIAAALAALRADALPWTAEQREADRRSHPRLAMLLEARRLREAAASKIAALPAEAADERSRQQAVLAAGDRGIAELERLVDGRRTWEFEEPWQRFQHRTLTELLADLEAFADPERGPHARVQQRLQWARTIRRRTIDDHRHDWDAAIAAVAADARYGDLLLTPQVGLVPLGADPDSGMQEFAHLASGEPPTRDPVTRRLLLPERSCIVFVLLPASPGFVIGAQPTDGNGRNYDPHSQPGEGPPHRVPLAAFLLSKYELTQGQWLALMGDNPSVLLAGTTHLGRRISWLDPVTNIDWLRADQAMRRHGLALPTEAQWEYGCRGGKSTAWWTGNDRDSLRRDGAAANIADHSAFAFLERWPDVADWPDYDDGFPYHAPVGSFRANPFGLSEMHGNVLEWCADGPAEYGSVQPPRPGDGFRSGGKAGHRIARGGSFTAKATLCRSAYRVDVSETTNFLNLGLRPAQRLLP